MHATSVVKVNSVSIMHGVTPHTTKCASAAAYGSSAEQLGDRYAAPSDSFALARTRRRRSRSTCLRSPASSISHRRAMGRSRSEFSLKQQRPTAILEHAGRLLRSKGLRALAEVATLVDVTDTTCAHDAQTGSWSSGVRQVITRAADWHKQRVPKT